MEVKHLVMYSGGIGSWAAAKRVVEKHGTEGVVLLFADTMIEDPDLYRFLDETTEEIGIPLTRIADGRTPWQVFKDTKFLGNTQVDPCSRILKRELLNRWRSDNCDVGVTVTHFGIDWSESHRIKRLAERMKPWKVEAPMCDKPYLTKLGMLKLLKRIGISRPALYDEGFPHNNCNGGCIKAGVAHFVHLLKRRPKVFAEWENNEQEMRDYLGADVSILRDRSGNEVRPLTLRQVREKVEARTEQQLDLFDWGGCGCAID